MSEKKIAVVTGGARGIGKAIALELAKAGNLVVINYNGSEEKARETKAEIEAAGGQADILQCNVADYEGCEAFIKAVIEQFGRIDILVNNAGITKDGLLMRMKEEDWDAVLTTNLKGVINCTKAANKYMMKQKAGKIVSISSVVGLMGNAGQANYAAAKAGVIGFTKSVAKEVAARGINVNAVAPGFIKTDMTSVLSDKVVEGMLTSIPLHKLCETTDIAKAVVFLVSDAANYITGQTLHVDGGMVMYRGPVWETCNFTYWKEVNRNEHFRKSKRHHC